MLMKIFIKRAEFSGRFISSHYAEIISSEAFEEYIIKMSFGMLLNDKILASHFFIDFKLCGLGIFRLIFSGKIKYYPRIIFRRISGDKLYIFYSFGNKKLESFIVNGSSGSVFKVPDNSSGFFVHHIFYGKMPYDILRIGGINGNGNGLIKHLKYLSICFYTAGFKESGRQNLFLSIKAYP